MTATIRRALSSEAEALTAIALSSKRSWGYDDAFMERIMPEMIVTREMIERGHALVACDASGLVGYVLIRMENDTDAYLNDLFVIPRCMRSGVGRALLARAVEWSHSQGAKRIELVSDPNAAGFYERFGFAHDGDVASDFVEGRTLPKMSLLL